METNFIYFLIWFVVLVVLFWLMPNKKIVVIGDFFRKVLPTIPFTSIAKVLKKEKTDEE